MLILGILQIRARPREPGDGLYQRFVNLGTLWSLCCITVGIGLLAMATGWWTPDFVKAPAHKKPPIIHAR